MYRTEKEDQMKMTTAKGWCPVLVGAMVSMLVAAPQAHSEKAGSLSLK